MAQATPNHWITGNTIGVDVDDRDHIFTVHRNTENMFGGRTEIGLALGVAECCTPAPPILEYDIEGNLINAWGGPVEGAPYQWPGVKPRHRSRCQRRRLDWWQRRS